MTTTAVKHNGSKLNIPATAKQVALIKKLATEKDWTATPLAEAMQEVLSGTEIKIDTASLLINQLFALPGAAVKKMIAEALVDGFYVKDNVIYKVQTSGANRKYAKALSSKGGFYYAAGAVMKLTAADKLTIEVAQQYGKTYGICCCCGATLTDAKSVEAGIGPICAKNNF